MVNRSFSTPQTTTQSGSRPHRNNTFPFISNNNHARRPLTSMMTSSSIADHEDLFNNGFTDTNSTVRSSVRPRWERKEQGDRFIPNRGAIDMDVSSHMLRNNDENSRNASNSTVSTGTVSEASKEDYRSALSETLLGVDSQKSSRILSFKERAPDTPGDTVNNLNILYSASAGASSRVKSKSASQLVSRQIPNSPSRILDAPDLMDDYYLNLLSWSDTNILAVALSQTVYLWNAGTGDIKELCTVDGGMDAHVSSVRWVKEGGSHLAVGTSQGTTLLWDVCANKQVRKLDGHSERVGALAWNKHILSTASRDTRIVNHDVRIAQHRVATMRSHTQEVCGLEWNNEGDTLASGGNDNKLCLWDVATSSTSSPRFELTDHQAAVKALSWSPHERNLIASGGGTADRTIKFWNSRTGALLNSIDTESQVCALEWNPFEKEILSSHGYARNQLCLWKYPSMIKIKELEGHTARVLHMARSPNGGTVVSAAADETLRFWDVFCPPSKSKASSSRKRNGKATGTMDLPAMKFSRTMQLR